MSAVADMTADEIRAALAEAGARRKRAITAEIEAWTGLTVVSPVPN